MTVSYLLAALESPDEAPDDLERERLRRRARLRTDDERGDAVLVERIRRGDELAFATFFEQHARALTIIAMAVVRSPDIADDVVQSVMLRLWRKRETLEVTGDVVAYLRSAVYNEAKNALRHDLRVRRRAERAATLGEASPRASALPDANMMQQELATVVRQAIDALPERAGEVFRLWLYADLSYAEIATTLGISVKGVEQGRTRALTMLRRTLLPSLRALEG